METMQFNKTQMDLFLKAVFFLHLSGPIEQIGIHAKMSKMFNVRLTNSLGTSLSNVFPYFSSFN